MDKAGVICGGKGSEPSSMLNISPVGFDMTVGVEELAVDTAEVVVLLTVDEVREFVIELGAAEPVAWLDGDAALVAAAGDVEASIEVVTGAGLLGSRG